MEQCSSSYGHCILLYSHCLSVKLHSLILLHVSKTSLLGVYVTWLEVIFALENVIGTCLSLSTLQLLSPYIALQIILQNNYEMYETVLAQAICISEA